MNSRPQDQETHAPLTEPARRSHKPLSRHCFRSRTASPSRTAPAHSNQSEQFQGPHPKQAHTSVLPSGLPDMPLGPSPTSLWVSNLPIFQGPNQLAAKLTLLTQHLPIFFTPWRTQNRILTVTFVWHTAVKEQSCSQPEENGRGIWLPQAPLICPEANGSQNFQRTVHKLLAPFLDLSHRC